MKATQSSRQGIGVAVASAVVLMAIFYRSAWLFDEVAYSRDILPYFLPVRQFVRDSILSFGALPRWNPHQFGGVDLLGDPTFGLLYPPNWLVLPLAPAPALTLLLALHHVIAATGAALLVRRWGGRAAACTVAALALAFCGYTLSVTDNILYLFGFAWTPWALWASDRLVRPGAVESRLSAPARVVPLALVLAVQALAGDVQGSYATGALCAAWVGVASVRGERLSAAALFAASGALAALLAAPQLLPMANVFAASSRAGGMAAELADRWSLHPLRLVELVAPWFFGSTHGEQTFWGRGLVNHETGIPFVYSLYLGVPTLVCAGLAWRVRSHRRAVVFVAVGAGLAALVALGQYTPVNGWLRAVLPLWDSFRYPVKSFAVVALLLALLAGIGLGALKDGAESLPRRWLWLPGVFAVVSGVAALWLRSEPTAVSAWMGRLAQEAAVDPGAPLQTSDRALLWATATSLATLALLGAHTRGLLSAHRTRVALVLLIAVDLVAANQRLVRTAPQWMIADTPLLAEAILDDAGESVTPPRLYRAELPPMDTTRTPDVALYVTYKGWQHYTLAPAVAQGHGIAYALGNGVTASTRARALWQALVPRGERALQVTGVTHVLAPADATIFADEARFRTIHLNPYTALRVVALRDPMPFARRVHAVRHAPDDAAALALLASDSLDPRREVVLTDGTPDAPVTPPPEPTPAQVVRYEPHLVEIESDGPAGLLVTADAHHDDWHVEVDGVPAELLRANTYYRAVALEAGPHRVVFRHESRAFAWGIRLFALGALTIGLWWGAVVLSRRRARQG